MNILKLLRALSAYRAGAPLGDVAVLKLDALAAPNYALAALRRGSSPHDLPALRGLAAGTLGRAYADFLDANGITPLVVSPRIRAEFRAEPYALRYTATHDLHHVLTGFDTGLAGEAGVLAFNVGQGVAPISRAMLSLAAIVYTIISPTQARAIANNVRVGLAMGKSAKLVIAAPIESYFDEPLDDVRRRLSISDPIAAGVRRSGSSWIMEWFQPSRRSMCSSASTD